jgi:hypothetical protein
MMNNIINIMKEYDNIKSFKTLMQTEYVTM